MMVKVHCFRYEMAQSVRRKKPIHGIMSMAKLFKIKNPVILISEHMEFNFVMYS